MPVDPLVREMQILFQELLDLDCLPAPDTNFFNLGGSSMMASQLASKVRKKHEVPFTGAEVFHFASCSAIAGMVRQRGEEIQSAGSGAHSNPGSAGDPSEWQARGLDPPVLQRPIISRMSTTKELLSLQVAVSQREDACHGSSS